MLDDDRTALHDAAYRYAFRRSLSTRLASSAAREAVESLEVHAAVGPRVPGGEGQAATSAIGPAPAWDATDDGPLAPDRGTGRDAGTDSDRVAVLRAARTALERYRPSTLPPRVTGDARLQAALADLAPADRELLLLHLWDGLPADDATRMAGCEPGRLPMVESTCARKALPGDRTSDDEGAGGRTSDDEGAGGRTSDDVATDDAVAEVAVTGNAVTGDAVTGPAAASTLPETDVSIALAAALTAADPATAITGEDLARSRRGLVGTGTGGTPSTGEQPATAAARTTGITSSSTPPAAVSGPPGHGDRPRPPARAPSRRVQVILGTLCLLAVVAGLIVALIPRAAPGPAGDVERLFALADVVAIASVEGVEPTKVNGELRMLQAASVVQIVKGDADGTTLIIDVTGRSTQERPYSRNLFPPDRLLFLTRDGDGVLSPIEGEGSVLTLIDRRSPEATTIAGDPAPLPDELRDAIRALPKEELRLDTSGSPAGSLPADSVVGTRPPEGRDVQNLPADRLGTFQVLSAGAGRACVVFEYNGRSVLIRWPEGFSAYEREEVLSYPDEDPQRGRQVLTVLNERGYPYVDESRRAPFISGTPTGGRGECGGQELDVWDIAVEPGTTLLSY